MRRNMVAHGTVCHSVLSSACDAPSVGSDRLCLLRPGLSTDAPWAFNEGIGC